MHQVSTKENENTKRKSQNRACMQRVRSDKENEQPLMSTPINKAMLRNVAENENETV